MSDTRIYYWIYSRTQQDRIDEANKAAGLVNPTYGKVVVNGSQKIYTDIVTDMSRTPFADAKIVIKGRKDKISYTLPNF
jgi:hypothetical protein